MTAPKPPDREELLKVEKALREMERRKRESALDFYKPYPKQQEFHDLGASKRERLLMAANQVGKTYAGAAEMAMHLTGLYPDWWAGRRFDRPISAWVGCDTGVNVRDGAQRLLFGKAMDKDQRGTGTVPKNCVDWEKDVSLARGVTGLFDTVFVKHVSGKKSKCAFKTYQSGRESWQGETLDVVWYDEEPPEDIYLEGLTRTNATNGLVYMTFTPMLGHSTVVEKFLKEKRGDPGAAYRGFVQMSLDDARHFTPEQRAAIIASYPEYMRDARTKGVPMLGGGAVFPIAEDKIAVDSFKVPDYWPLLWGCDFGTTHPFAAALLAWDRDADIVYVIHTVRMADARPMDHAAAMKPSGPNIRVAWPHDGNKRETSLDPLVATYRKHGLRMLETHSAFPDGSISTDAGLSLMWERMTTGRFKVFKHLVDWWEEFRLYHRKEGLVVKIRDDLMSATRTGVVMLRKAQEGRFAPPLSKEGVIAKGTDDWDVFTGRGYGGG